MPPVPPERLQNSPRSNLDLSSAYLELNANFSFGQIHLFPPLQFSIDIIDHSRDYLET